MLSDTLACGQLALVSASSGSLKLCVIDSTAVHCLNCAASLKNCLKTLGYFDLAVQVILDGALRKNGEELSRFCLFFFFPAVVQLMVKLYSVAISFLFFEVPFLIQAGPLLFMRCKVMSFSFHLL